VLAVLCCLGRTAGAEGWQTKPLLILADKRGQADVMRNICARYRYFYQMSASLPADKLAQCHTVIVANGGGISGANHDNLTEFLKQGGNLLLPGRNAGPFLGRLPEVFGPEARLAQASAPGFALAKHPLFPQKEVDDEAAMAEEDEETGTAGKGRRKDGWDTTLYGTVLSKPLGGQALVYGGDQAAVWLKPVGNGKVVFLADGVFPLVEVKSKVCVVPGYDEFLDRLFQFLAVPTLEKAAGEYGKSVVWQRDPPLEGGRTLLPPFPASENEVVDKLVLHVGQNEHERIPFHTTVPFVPQQVEVVVGEFVRQGGGAIPPDRVKIGCQGRLSESYRGPLIYIRWLDNGEKLAFGSPVMTWWLSVRTGDVAGIYKGQVDLKLGEQSFSIPVEVNVEEACIPLRRPFRYDVEFYVSQLPEGKSLPALEELGVDFFVGGMPESSLMDPAVRSTGESLAVLARKAQKPLRDDLPLLDFSGWLGRGDLFLQDLLRHNITRFRTYQFLGCGSGSFVPLTQALFRDDSLSVASPENERTIVAVMREARRFLSEKGILGCYSKYMDEWAGTEVDAYLKVAVPLAKAGWRNVANPNPRTPLANRAQRRRLWPFIHLYWMEDEPELWYDLIRLEPSLPGKEFQREYYTVLASSVWWYLGYLTGPQFAWGCAYRGYSGLHQHGWRRWTYETYNAIYLPEKQQYCPSMGILMMAEGIEESQYGHILREMIAYLAKQPQTKDKALELEKKWHGVVGESPEALLPVVKDVVWRPGLTRAEFTKAKLQVLGLLAEARQALGEVGVRPTMRWGEFDFVRDGKPQVTIVATSPSRAAELLRRAIALEAGVELPVEEMPADPAQWPRVQDKAVLVEGSDADLLQKVESHLRGAVSRRYPQEGAYVIHQDERGNLWVVARGAETLALGVENLIQAADLVPCWYRPEMSSQPVKGGQP
jgi:hypothetical protein